jgi:hypothetical protein
MIEHEQKRNGKQETTMEIGNAGAVGNPAIQKVNFNTSNVSRVTQAEGAFSQHGPDNVMKSVGGFGVQAIGGVDLGEAKSGPAGFDADATRIDLIA